MSKEEKDIVVKNDTTDTTEEKDNSTSFLVVLKNKLRLLILKIMNLRKIVIPILMNPLLKKNFEKKKKK